MFPHAKNMMPEKYIYLIINVLNTRNFITPKAEFWGIKISWGNNTPSTSSPTC